jgi:hypothetical protein
VRLQRGDDVAIDVDLEQRLLQLALTATRPDVEDALLVVASLGGIQPHQLHRSRPGVLHVDQVGHDVDVVGGPIGGQHPALRISDHAARGRQRDSTDDVAPRLRAVARRLCDLQLGEAGREHAERQQNAEHHEMVAAAKLAHV